MRRTLYIAVWALASATASAAEVASVEGANLQRPVWAPDGSRLSYEANFHDQKSVDLWVGSPERGFARVAASPRGSNPLVAGFATAPRSRVVHELAWSPAGLGRFVYAASNDLSDFDLHLDSGEPLAPAPGTDGGARWSPDGRYVAFTSSRTGEGDVYLLDMFSIDEPPRRLTRQEGASELYLSWSADSARLVYTGHSPSGDNLWLLPSLGEPPVQLTDWPGHQIRPTFSPSSDQIAFYANHTDPARFDLYVIAAEPSATPRRVATGVVPNARGPSWTPQGGHLIVVRNDDAQYDPIVAVNVKNSLRTAPLALDTVGHGDLDVVARSGELVVAYVAQGLKVDQQRNFKRLFVAPVGPLP